MHIGGGGVGIGDDPQSAIHRAMIEIEEALGLALAHHIAGILVGPADLGLFHCGLALGRLERLLAMLVPIRIDRPVQIVPIVGPRLGNQLQVVFALVGIGLEMRAVGIEHRPIHQAMADRLLDDGVEYVLGHTRIGEASPPALAQGRGIEHAIGQLQAQEPAIGHVDRDLAHQLPFRANAEQVADEQGLEHQGRIERRTAVVGAVQARNPIMNEREVDHRIDPTQKVIGGYQLFERYHLKSGLFGAGFAQHAPMNQKPPACARGLSAV